MSEWLTINLLILFNIENTTHIIIIYSNTYMLTCILYIPQFDTFLCDKQKFAINVMWYVLFSYIYSILHRFYVHSILIPVTILKPEKNSYTWRKNVTLFLLGAFGCICICLSLLQMFVCVYDSKNICDQFNAWPLQYQMRTIFGFVVFAFNRWQRVRRKTEK